MIGLLACSPSERSLSNHPVDSPFCPLDMPFSEAVTQNCAISLFDSSFTLHASQPAMPEEVMLTLGLQLPVEWQVVTAELSGESMYMGRIPLRFMRQESESRQVVENERLFWSSPLRFGACVTEPMIWRLTLTLAESAQENAAQQTLSVSFAALPMRKQ